MATLARIVRRVFLKQTLTYWQKNGSDEFGKPLFDAGVELKCRWEDRPQEVILPDGRKVLSKTYILMADDLLAGSVIFLGTIAQYNALQVAPDPPTQNQGGQEVMLSKKTPDIKNKSTIYEVYC